MNCTEIAPLFPLYLSRELDAARAAGFAAHLKACPECAGEMEQQAKFDALLRDGALAGDHGNEELDRRIRQRIAAESGVKRPRRLFAAAGIAAALVLGVFSYRALFGPQLVRVYADAAEDHRDEIVNGQQRKWISDREAIEALADRQGLPRAIPIALALSGYGLERAKLCRLDGRVFMHLVYTDGAREVSVFLRQREGGDPIQQPVCRDVGHEHVAFVEGGQVTAMIVTNQSSEAALSLARAAAGVL